VSRGGEVREENRELGFNWMEGSLEEVAFELLENSTAGVRDGFAPAARFPVVMEWGACRV
jgi:hypothetical protein